MRRMARFYGIPVYFDPEDNNRMIGRNLFADLAARIMLYLHVVLLLGDFRVKLEDQDGD